MKKIQFLLLFCGYFLLTGLFMSAQKQADINFTSTPPTIDGVADDAVWASAAANVNDSIQTGTIDDANDCSGSWKAVWDMNNIYILVDVTDNILFDNNGAPSWNTDNLEIYFQLDNERNGTGPKVSHGTQYSFQWNNTTGGQTGEGSYDNVEYARVDKGTATLGYVIEVKIPWASMRADYAIANDNAIAFDVNIVDNDDGSGHSALYWNSTAGLWSNMDKAGIITLKGGPVTGQFSDIAGYGEAGNYLPKGHTELWSLIQDGDNVYYGVDVEKSTDGSFRRSIYDAATLDHNYYVEADVKLYPRSSTAPTFEDAILYFSYMDEDNFASAWYFIHPWSEADANSWDPYGLSGFEIKVNGTEYRLKHFDTPGDPIEEIPAGSAIPYNDDMASFDAWNKIRLERSGTILSMVVNGETYWELDVDTLTVINLKGKSDIVPIPQEVKDLLLGKGKIGVGSGNDKLYFDNIDAGELLVEGIFSDIPVYGDAANYTETNSFLWSIIEEDGNTYYGVPVEKSKNGSRRQSICEAVELSNNFFIESDVKLYPRSSTAPTFEDAILYFNYADDDNFASAWYFIHPWSEADANSWDPYGLSGFEIKVNGTEYRLKHFDTPADPVEEIPAGSAIPYNGDMASFDAWNNIRLERSGTILSMVVNDETYWEIDVDTLTVINLKGKSDIVPIPQEVKDLLLGKGKFGVGSGNDKLYFDNIDAGELLVEGVFSDIPSLGDAANYTETNAFLWSIIEEDGNTYYGVPVEKSKNGSRRQSIYEAQEYSGNYFVETDVKIFPRSSTAPTFEDAILYFSYVDNDNFASAWYFIHPWSEADANSWDPYGLSGFEIKVNGTEYRLKHFDTPADPVEEIPAGSAIPYNGDMASFDAWNNIRLERSGTILSMVVNDETYWEIDVDTLTVINLKGKSDIVPIPQEVKDLLLGKGKIGVGSGNDKLYFDNINAGELLVEGVFSDIPSLGDAANYTETNAFLWSIIEEDGNTYYGVPVEKSKNGSRRQSIYESQEYSGNYFVETDVKIFPRSSTAPTFEDAILYFSYVDNDNYASAWYFIHPWTEADANSWDPYGLSGFEVKVNGTEYRLKHFDTPGDPVEEIPAGSAIPYNDDMASFDAWNNIRLERSGTILSMVVNDETYWEIDVDTLTVINLKGKSDIVPIPQEVKDLLLGKGKIGVGSGNDKLYFDNINAGELLVEGVFSDIPSLGDAANYTETNAFLWSIIEDGENIYYGVDVEKATNGSRRQSIYEATELSNDFYVETDVKLFPRSSTAPTFEDAILYFNYADEDNYASAWYFIHPWTEADANSWDPYGLSGFEVKVNGTDYRLKHFDDPGDPVEEIPAGSAIPYNNDMTSFDAWNNIRLERQGTILSMVVNDELYWSIDIDTLTVINLKGKSDIVPIPQEVKDLLLGSGKFGVGSGNDKLYFDNIDAGKLVIPVTGKFSDIAFLGEAGNYSEVQPELWGVIEDGGDTRYGITAPKEKGGNRMSILNEKTYEGDMYVEAQAKLFKRVSGGANTAWWEDAILVFAYTDASNYAFAEFFNTHGPNTGTGNDAYGLSGFNVVADGIRYKMKKGDSPEDAVEEIPAETCIPFVDDNSFNDWNTIRVEREGSIIRMKVNEEVYYQIDADTLTVAQTSGATMEAIPDIVKNILKGGGQIGLSSGNDQVYFDNVKAGALGGVEPSDLTVSGITVDGVAVPDFVAGVLADQYTFDLGKADTTGIAGKLAVATNSTTTSFEIISVTNDAANSVITIAFKVVGEDNSEAQSKILISYTVGISESSLSALKVYPNPVANSINISNSVNILKVEFINIYGSLVKVIDNNNSASLQIDTNDLEAGMYLLNIQSVQGESAVLRIVKK